MRNKRKEVQNMSNWISVKDRLPAKGIDVRCQLCGKQFTLTQDSLFIKNNAKFGISYILACIINKQVIVNCDECERKTVSPCIRKGCESPASCCGCPEYDEWRKSHK